jgi:TM2 domain-containing membrane protein YozV
MESQVPSTEISQRSRGVALLLGSIIGVFGGHRFYVGKPVSGVCMALTFGGLGIWWLYDIILIAAGSFRDDEDKRLVRWGETNPLVEPTAGRLPQQLNLVLDELDALRGEVGELGERVDFMERVIAQAKDREALPPAAGL